jgi:glucose/arabinose dehydrogenase
MMATRKLISFKLFPALAVIGSAFFCQALSAAADPSGIKLPPGFHISVYTDQTPDVRSLAMDESGTVYAGTMSAGKVYAVRDENRDGKADRVSLLASGLNMPNGVACLDGDLYVAEISRILKFKAIARQLANPPKPETVFEGFPKDVHHGWKYLRVGPDRKLYTAVGAPCNICLPEKGIYATLTRLDTDGGNFEVFARGVRNTVGFDWHPDTRELWFTDNGRDWLGDDLPPEELNHAPRPGLHFGYPYCHGKDIADPEFGKLKSCSQFTPPAWTFPAHVAPLGVRFYTGQQFPPEYRGQLFVAQHGSWNRSTPQGYRVVAVRFEAGKPVAEQVFAEGWLNPTHEVTGRPVDILQMPDGALLVSDDKRGVIYRISYQPR